MPLCLQAVAHANLLTYEVDALRALMLTGGVSAFGLGADFTVLLVAVAIMVVIGEVVSEGGDLIRVRIVFWSVPVIELLERLQIQCGVPEIR